MRNPLPSLSRLLRHRAGGRDGARGQSLVELALALPVILLLTLIALDFGRVYLGYINLQNMARIGANYAANDPDAWGTPADTDAQTQYRNQILADASATNCQLPQSGGQPVVPDPIFTDVTGDGNPTGLGDTGTVRITCTFGVITPFISNILGGSVQVTAPPYVRSSKPFSSSERKSWRIVTVLTCIASLRVLTETRPFLRSSSRMARRRSSTNSGSDMVDTTFWRTYTDIK